LDLRGREAGKDCRRSFIHNLCASPDIIIIIIIIIIRVIELGRMRWAAHIARMGQIRNG
jgi:hypothetical protein